jgi:hypothetical protein
MNDSAFLMAEHFLEGNVYMNRQAGGIIYESIFIAVPLLVE